MMNDIRLALRSILQHGWFSAAIVLTLALGIGANTTVFTLVNAVLFKPLAMPAGSRLVVINGNHLDRADGLTGVSYPDVLAFQQARSFEAVEAMQGMAGMISEPNVPAAEFRLANVTWRMFESIQAAPVIGRRFTEADSHPGAQPVVVIGHRVWINRYGGASDVLGRAIKVNGKPTVIIGVMAEGMRFPSGQDLWMPLIASEELLDRSRHDLMAFGVLREGVSRAEGGRELAALAERLAREQPATNKNLGAAVRTFHEAFNGSNVRTLFLLMLGAVGFVLLIACANAANTMLSRSLARRREISVRAALGASRWQLMRQMLAEAVSLSALGGAAGLALSQFGVRYFDNATAEFRPYWILFEMDWVAFAYFGGVTIGTGILSGILPALRGSRTDLNAELKEGARSAGNRRTGWLASGLVVVQFGLAAVLLSAAGLMIRSFFEAQAVNSFLRAEQLFTARVMLPSWKGERYVSSESRLRFFGELNERLKSMPGVTQSAIVSSLPGTGSWNRPVEIEGQAVAAGGKAPQAGEISAMPGYFRTAGLAIEAGRDFDAADGAPGRESVIVSRDFADRHFAGVSPLGRRIRFAVQTKKDKPGPWLEIVGVSSGFVQTLQTSNAQPPIFVTHRQVASGGMYVMLRSPAGTRPDSLASGLRSIVQQIDPDLPLYDLRTMSDVRERQRWFLRVFGSLFSAFALIGVVIAALGVYAVVAQAAAMRTREIGIRMALGATRAAILVNMTSRGARQMAAGLVLGFAGALAAARLMTDFMVGISPRDPAVFAVVASLLAVTGMLASWLPARRAAALDPVTALRNE